MTLHIKPAREFTACLILLTIYQDPNISLGDWSESSMTANSTDEGNLPMKLKMINNTSTHNNFDNDNPTTIQETPISQMPDIDNPTTIHETPISQKPEPSHHQSATIDQPDAPRLPTDNEKDLRTVVPHPIKDLTIEEFPTLPTPTPVPNLDTQEIPDINKFLDDLMEPYTTQHNQHNPNNLQKTTRPNFR